jgi:hypothetical protein
VSNHDGSYMLRDVLTLLDSAGIWEQMPRAKMQQLVVEMVRFACHRHDCNAGEILDGHEKLGVCYYCWSPGKTLRRGICQACRAKSGIDVDDVDETVAEVAELPGVALQQAIEDTVIVRFPNTPIVLARKLRSVSDLEQLTELRRKVLEAPDQAAVEMLLAALPPVA